MTERRFMAFVFASAILVTGFLAIPSLPTPSISVHAAGEIQPTGGETLECVLLGPEDAVEAYIMGSDDANGAIGPIILEDGFVVTTLDMDFFDGVSLARVYYLDDHGDLVLFEEIEW